MFKNFSFPFFLLTFSFLLIQIFSPIKIYPHTLENLIFVQVPADDKSTDNRTIQIYSPMDCYIKNTRIVKFTPGSEKLVNLTEDFFGAADPDISFDGMHIIFSGKKEAGDYWQIW